MKSISMSTPETFWILDFRFRIGIEDRESKSLITVTWKHEFSIHHQPDNTREITFGQAINEALAEEMRRDPTCFYHR